MSGRVGAYLRQNVLGLVAIFLALSAGAYAVQKAPKNSVVSKSIKNGQVKNADVGAAAVSADKLGPGAVTADKLGAGAVTATKLGAGAVTTDGLGAGAVTTDKLGFDPATQGELDTTASALSGLASPGTINSGGNPVDWTKLKNVPDGFADGFDRLFGLANGDATGNPTPSVENLSVLTVNAPAPGPLVITDLTGGVSGQVVTLFDVSGGGAVTINDANPFVLNGTWNSTDTDTLTLVRIFGALWVEVARSAN